ncbi:MAG: DUF4276 family protein [Pseudomonadota bacterium]
MCSDTISLLRIFPGYKKRLHGPLALERMGLNRIREECLHFDMWLSKLDAFADA